MLEPPKDVNRSKVRLQNENQPPDRACLEKAHSHAVEHQGVEVEVAWSEPSSGRSRSLVVKMDSGKDQPTWLLWEDNGAETKLIWNYDTIDIDLINDLLLMLNRAGSQAAASPQASAPAAPLASTPVSANPQKSPAAPPVPNTTAESAHNLYLDIKSQQGPGGSIRTSLSGLKAHGIGQQDMLSPSQQPNRITGSHPTRTTGSHGPTRITGSHGSFSVFQENTFVPAGALSPELQPPPPPEPALPAEPAEPKPTYENSPAGQAVGALLKAANALNGKSIPGLIASSPGTFEGNLDFVQTATLLRTVAMAQLTGKLEVIGEESVGTIFFTSGVPHHATTTASSGDQAIAEIVSWLKGGFRFSLDDRSAVRSVNESLDRGIMDGIALLDKKKHLESAGLTHESYLVKKHKRVSDSELKVFLMKSSDVELDVQMEVYKKIGARCTLADLLRDRPMESSLWTRILFNFLTCELIEIKPPDAKVRGLFDFLGESKGAIQGVESAFLRPETGIFTYEALLYFMQYEFFRYEAYGWPFALALMEMSKRSQELESGLDLISQHEAAIAVKRLEMLKRPLDMIGHFETLHYALLFPNTRASQAAYVANRALQALTAAPLSTGLDKRNLHIAFGIAAVPADADDIESLLISAKKALGKATEGDFPVVVAHGVR